MIGFVVNALGLQIRWKRAADKGSQDTPLSIIFKASVDIKASEGSLPACGHPFQCLDRSQSRLGRDRWLPMSILSGPESI